MSSLGFRKKKKRVIFTGVFAVRKIVSNFLYVLHTNVYFHTFLNFYQWICNRLLLILRQMMLKPKNQNIKTLFIQSEDPVNNEQIYFFFFTGRKIC